jgi:hypothetical protein
LSVRKSLTVAFGAAQALCLHLDERFPGIHETAQPRQRPVNQVEVDAIHAEILHRLAYRCSRLC